jgi:hypothetical protein
MNAHIDGGAAPGDPDMVMHNYDAIIAHWLGSRLDLLSGSENVAAICFTSGSMGIANLSALSCG